MDGGNPGIYQTQSSNPMDMDTSPDFEIKKKIKTSLSQLDSIDNMSFINFMIRY